MHGTNWGCGVQRPSWAHKRKAPCKHQLQGAFLEPIASEPRAEVQVQFVVATLGSIGTGVLSQGHPAAFDNAPVIQRQRQRTACIAQAQPHAGSGIAV